MEISPIPQGRRARRIFPAPPAPAGDLLRGIPLETPDPRQVHHPLRLRRQMDPDEGVGGHEGPARQQGKNKRIAATRASEEREHEAAEQ